MPEHHQSDSTQLQDSAQPIEFDFSMALERIDNWIDGGIRLLPNIVTSIVVFAIFYGFSLLAYKFIQNQSTRWERRNLGQVLGGLAKWGIISLGFLLAATIVIPSLKPGDLIAGLGVSSVAIGFAFKDILQNWLAGLLILLRQPFNIEDQIKVNEFEGTVKRIETRATIIKTYDGQRIVIPNSQIYTNSILVKTAHTNRRSQYDVGIGYGDNIDEACVIIQEAVATLDIVENEPPPEALVWELAASWVTIRVRWWTGSRRSTVVKAHSAVIKVIKQALDKAKIDMPYVTQVHLIHDQTESKDGDRGTQREGWPAPEEGSTQPRWKAQADYHEDKDF